MDITKMLRRTVIYHRQSELKSRFRDFPVTRLKNTYVELDVALAKLADLMGWFHEKMPRVTSEFKQRLLKQYVQCLSKYLLIANLKNWNQLVLISQKEWQKLASRDKSKDLNQLYLAIKNMLYNSYFSHRQDDFMFSWKLYLKLGTVDLGLTAKQIESCFYDEFPLKS